MKTRTPTAKTACLLLLAAVTAATATACGSAPATASDAAPRAHLTAARTASAPADAQAAAKKTAKATAAQTAAQKPGQPAAAKAAAATETAHGDTAETLPEPWEDTGFFDTDETDTVDDTACDEPFDEEDGETAATVETDDPEEESTETGDEPEETTDPLSALEGGMWFVYGFGHPDFTAYTFDGDTVTLTRYITRIGETWEYCQYGEPQTLTYTVTAGGIVAGDVTLSLTDDENRLRVTREDPYNYCRDDKRYFEDFAYRHSELPAEEELRAESAENSAARSFRPME